MSGDTSPQLPTPISASYAQQATPITSAPASHLPSSSTAFTDSAQSFSSDMLSKSDGSDDPNSSTQSMKGKNGATGPTEGKSKPHVCQICQRGFTTGGHLQRHQRIHTGVKAFKCPFPGCETRTSRQDNLQQHYRTHLSPTLRRGSGSAARAAVAAAMEAAGLKSSSTRAPRKSKGSTGGTPSSTASANTGHLPSPFQTPTSQGPGGPYAPYGMYDPQQYGYPTHTLPPPLSMAPNQSANSSRVPSPVNGHSSSHSSVGSMPGAHQQPYFSQPFSPAYPYMSNQQPYRYAAPGSMPSPYGAGPHPHHGLYSPGIASEHGQPHMYSPMQTAFPTHSRESSYGVVTPAYPPSGLGNGYPPRTQTTTPLSSSAATHEDRRYPSPPGRRRTPPDLLSQGVVDPSSMTSRIPSGIPSSYAYQAQSYTYNGPPQMLQRDPTHRASISSLSEDGSGAGGSDGSAAKVLHHQ